MNKNKVLSAKHPSQCSSGSDKFKKNSQIRRLELAVKRAEHKTGDISDQEDKFQSYKTRKLELSVKRMKRKTGDKSEKRENEWADSNTEVRIDNNDIVKLSILSDHIRILGDIPYDFDAETDVDG